MEKGDVIGKGRAAEVIYWGNNRVLKLFYKDFPRHIIDYIYTVDGLIGKSFPYSPKVFEKIEDNGRIGIIYEYIEGITLIDFMRKKKNIGNALRLLAEIHVEMHKHEIRDINPLANFYKLAIHQTNLINEEQKKEIIDYLEQLPEANKICHGDYHPDNIILSNNKAYVIDWSNAYSGNPNSDVSRTYYILKYGTSPSDEKKSFITRFLLKSIRSRFAKLYLNHYLELTNISVEEIKRWDLVTYATRLREPVPLELNNLLKLINNSLKHLNNVP
ncbi:MAG: phosphotransferase family protein [Promethearchaeota archaeon]